MSNLHYVEFTRSQIPTSHQHFQQLVSHIYFDMLFNSFRIYPSPCFIQSASFTKIKYKHTKQLCFALLCLIFLKKWVCMLFFSTEASSGPSQVLSFWLQCSIYTLKIQVFTMKLLKAVRLRDGASESCLVARSLPDLILAGDISGSSLQVLSMRGFSSYTATLNCH